MSYLTIFLEKGGLIKSAPGGSSWTTLFKISLVWSVILFPVPGFSENDSYENNSTFLVCEKTRRNHSGKVDIAFMILEDVNGEKKKARFGRAPVDRRYFSTGGVPWDFDGVAISEEVDFVRVKDEWSGKIVLRDIELDISENQYSWSRDDSINTKTGNKIISGNVIKNQKFYLPDYENLKINRTNLELEYRLKRPGHYYTNSAETYFYGQCVVKEKETFEKNMFVVIDKGWRKGIKSEKKRLKQQKKLKPKVSPKI
jgi:hypothetical protein